MPAWLDLSASARAAVETELGGPVDPEGISYNADVTRPALDVVLRAVGGGTAHLKAMAVGHVSAGFHDAERDVHLAVGDRLPAPPMTWSAEVGGWKLMLFTSLDSRPANLRPGHSDMSMVLRMLTRLGNTLTPAPWPSSRSAASRVEFLRAAMARALDDPCLASASERATLGDALSLINPGDLDGDSLLHLNLNPTTLRRTMRRLYVTDWNTACHGPRWLDAARLAPSLIEAGHDASQAWRLLVEHVPALKSAPQKTLIGIAALDAIGRLEQARNAPRDRADAWCAASSAAAGWLRFCIHGPIGRCLDLVV